MIALYDVGMTTERVTITLDQEVLAYARRKADEGGLSLSAWLNGVAAHEKKIAEGLAAIEDTWAEIGQPTVEERAWGARMHEAVRSGADEVTLNRLMAEYPGHPGIPTIADNVPDRAA